MLGNLVSAGASIIGGFLNRSAAKDAQTATNINLQNQYEHQKEFAQNGIKWRAHDAKQAGIHPIYALGASTPTYTPQSASFAADNSLGNALGAAGQDIGRAINATRSAPERDAAFSTSIQRLQLEGMGLDNQIKQATLASSIQRLRANANPPLPIPEADKHGERPLGVVGGTKVHTDPLTSNVDDFWSKRYGEPGEWLGAPMVLWQDFKKNYGDNSALEILRDIDRRTSSSSIGSAATGVRSWFRRNLPAFGRR